MKHFNVTQWCLNHKEIVYFFLGLFSIAGLFSYLNLGRMEDPDYTIREMVVTASYPGASAKEVEEQVTERIEKALQDLDGLDNLESYSMPGTSVIYVEIKDTIVNDDIAGRWIDARNIIQGISGDLPEGTNVEINDHFDYVYGMIYALTADDGFSYLEMKEEAERIRHDVLTLPQTKRVELLGVRVPNLYIDVDPYKISNLGITMSEIETLLKSESMVSDSGYATTSKDLFFLRVTPRLTNYQDFGKLAISKNGQVFKLEDIANIHRDYSEDGEQQFFYKGKPAIGIAISMIGGENIIQYGEDLSKVLVKSTAALPAGMQLNNVVNQAQSVDNAIFTFVRSLIEAVLIIFAVSILSLGRRAGFIVVLCIPFVLAVTFAFMYVMKIDLQSVSLGGLIIGLGLLVDDAMIVVELIIVNLEKGMKKVDAIINSFRQTALPMLTGTVITCAGFIPIAFAKGSASEFCSSLFYVITIALLVSWVVAGTITPFLANIFINEEFANKRHEHKKLAIVEKFNSYYKKLLELVVKYHKTTIFITIIMFVLSCYGITEIREEYFPQSTRPELVVRLTLQPQASIKNMEEVASRFSHAIEGNDNIDYFSYTTGMGMPRFILTFDTADDKPGIAEFIFVAKDLAARNALEKDIRTLVAKDFPEVLLLAKPLAVGESAEYPVMLRVVGPKHEIVREIALHLENKMREHPNIINTFKKSGEQAIAMSVNVDPLKARQLGINAESLSNNIHYGMDGKVITSYQEGMNQIPVYLRTRISGKSNYLDDLETLPITLDSGAVVPLSQVADYKYVNEDSNIFRRNRMHAMLVCSEVTGNVSGDDVAYEVYESLEDYRASLPPGYDIEYAGTLADSETSQDDYMEPFPIMVIIILVCLMLQLQNITKTCITLLTAPLGIIGVTIGLYLMDKPYGFVVLLGILALGGIIIRNSVILIDQIEKQLALGESVYDA